MGDIFLGLNLHPTPSLHYFWFAFSGKEWRMTILHSRNSNNKFEANKLCVIKPPPHAFLTTFALCLLTLSLPTSSHPHPLPFSGDSPPLPPIYLGLYSSLSPLSPHPVICTFPSLCTWDLFSSPIPPPPPPFYLTHPLPPPCPSAWDFCPCQCCLETPSSFEWS